jgi:hypothetical protein
MNSLYLSGSKSVESNISICRYIQTGVPPARVSRPLASRCCLTEECDNPSVSLLTGWPSGRVMGYP